MQNTQNMHSCFKNAALCSILKIPCRNERLREGIPGEPKKQNTERKGRCGGVAVFLYIFFYIFTYVYVYLHIFCVFLYIFSIFSYKIDSLINGGRRRRPPPISLSILYEKNPKICTKTHKKYANTNKHM